MRLLLFRIGIAIVVLAALWLVTARWCSQMVDQVSTVPVGTLSPSPVRWDGVFLQFGADGEAMLGPEGWDDVGLLSGAHTLSLSGPGPDYKAPAIVEVDDQNRLTIAAGGRRIALGARAGDLSGSDGPIPAYAADSDDKTALTVEKSLLSWPTPFDLNFMTGRGSTWRRNLYYRLSWTKASGARLTMLWRFEQGYDPVNGWRSPGDGDGATGLIEVDIRPAR
jgi:hypothetical protein